MPSNKQINVDARMLIPSKQLDTMETTQENIPCVVMSPTGHIMIVIRSGNDVYGIDRSDGTLVPSQYRGTARFFKKLIELNETPS